MATYYVSKQGKDNNKGTTEDTSLLTISKALSLAVGGDTIFVKAGSYNESLNFTKNGSSGKLITLKGFGTDVPILDGQNRLTSLIEISGRSYIQIEQMKLMNVASNWSYGISVGEGSSYIYLKNIEITAIKHNSSGSSFGANPLIVSGYTSAVTNHVYIDNCYVHDNITGWCEAISIASNVEECHVSNCRVDNNGNIGVDFCGNFGDNPTASLDQPRNCSAIGNIISNCNSPIATSYGLYTDGAKNILFDRNIIFNCEGGIEVGSEEAIGKTYPCQNIIVRNNLVFGCKPYNGIGEGYAMNVGAYATSAGMVQDVKVYNNTFYGNTYGLNLDICNRIDFANNITINTNTNPLVMNPWASSRTQNVTFNKNIWFSTSRTTTNVTFEYNNSTVTGFSNFVTKTKETGKYENVTFKDVANNNFELVSGSSAIDYGTVVDYGELDLAGNSRVVGVVDCGAYEFNSSITPPTVDKTDLKSVIDVAKTKKQSNYTTVSWQPFSNALSQAEAIYNKANATQIEVDTAMTNLQNAMNNLVVNPVDPPEPSIPDFNELSKVIWYLGDVRMDALYFGNFKLVYGYDNTSGGEDPDPGLINIFPSFTGWDKDSNKVTVSNMTDYNVTVASTTAWDGINIVPSGLFNVGDKIRLGCESFTGGAGFALRIQDMSTWDDIVTVNSSTLEIEWTVTTTNVVFCINSSTRSQNCTITGAYLYIIK